MRISLNWINELVEVKNINVEDLVTKLTLGGFEVEEVSELKIGDSLETIIDISTTANRSDSLSIKGIAKEIAALNNQSYNFSNSLRNFFNFETMIRTSLLKNSKLKDCSMFMAVSIENLVKFSSPQWLKNKLLTNGLVPLDNLVDFQNYILIETGYPFELYDLDQIRSNNLKSELNLYLSFPLDNSAFLANNDLEYNLNKKILILKNDQQILSIGGIIVNQQYAYTKFTKRLLIEGSIFRSQRIRQMSRSLGLRTDRSARYEKGLNTSNYLQSFSRLISLLKISNPNLYCKLEVISHKKEKVVSEINLSYKNILEILGPIEINSNNSSQQLAPNQISEYLLRLDFQFFFNQQDFTWNVKIPSSRLDDIEREIDLIEEIGRLHGFNNFVTRLPKIPKIGEEDMSYQIRKKVTGCLLNEGLNELIHYTLVNNQDVNEIKIINPLLLEYSKLRSTLLPNILISVSENIKQGNINIEGFEFGHIFSSNSREISHTELESLAGVFGGIKTKTTWSNNSTLLSWFQGKGKIESIFKKLNLFPSWKNSRPQKYKNILHPYRTSKLFLNNNKMVGIFGQINPILSKNLNISSNLYLFEFNFSLLKTILKNNKLPVYNYYSLYPRIIKDLSIIVDQNISFNRLLTVVKGNGSKYLVDVQFLDEYKGNPIPPNFRSLCIQLTFQSNNKTLLNSEIETIIKNIQSILVQKFKIILRF